MATSQERSNVDTVRGAYEAFAEGDMEEIAELMAPEIEWVEPAGSRYAGTHHGFEAIAENVFEPSMNDVGGFEVRTERFIDCGESVVVLGSFHGSSHQSGDEFEIPFAHVCTCSEGQITGFRNFTDTAEWERVIGA